MTDALSVSSVKGVLGGQERFAALRCVQVALGVVFVSILTACDVKREWKEEVRLTNGAVIVVERSSRRERFGELGAAGYGKFKEEVLALPEPPTEWHTDTIPLALDVDRGNVYVIGWLRGWSECAKYGYPQPPFAYFRNTKAGGWEQIDPSGAPIHLKPNLLLNPWNESLEKTRSVVDLKTKTDLNESTFRAIPGLKDFHARGTRVDDSTLVKCVHPRSKN